ncbi:hypothetical protein HanXRQr2_Chr03g0114461 [Helianthus annuus]|uniref:Uncharacterized protein n=1 Tax=Helianthus annuus TaxID=4232 RepID=A0A9K3JHJ1_HELAN|nr:hypothetical protein HanXRQr2_Chr03g0114461 [Helianthus annuus]KAJ0943968.1 hypothetical protein HanPSC8_Chr03g0110801 [Helianthus annuus]
MQMQTDVMLMSNHQSDSFPRSLTEQFRLSVQDCSRQMLGVNWSSVNRHGSTIKYSFSFRNFKSYLSWTVGLTMRPDLFQAKACSKPMVKDLSGHCTVGVIRVPQLFYKQNAISKHITSNMEIMTRSPINGMF